ncbi:Sec14p-like phosphatidylinositol transfer family protein isoform 3 [Hibiscus syriacus]|uniref:Sec14p-like phosphatidylinositol transfer family protein isoform 3 n=1 Tax=Hibiscus syriacus TaxID=106335 RepID=A0A6A3BC73_HIBSY|nr:Sec14p-like phosphatidylinositol transfer family protein isoform 3 [Hibiscus syriacus]
MSSKELKGSAKDKNSSPQEKQAKKTYWPSSRPATRPLFRCIHIKIPYGKELEHQEGYQNVEKNNQVAAQYKPDMIKWEDIAEEAETGKIYRANYCDKFGRPVLVMRPGFQNTKSGSGQIKYLVYCMENAIMNLKQDQEQMVWLVDFLGLAKATVSVKLSRETARILQDHYPERLGLGILYNPPKLFQSSWMLLKPFLEPKTYQKLKFVYSNDPKCRKIIEEMFELDTLDAAFGGRNISGFDYQAYARQMKDDDVRMSTFLHSSCSSQSPHLSSILTDSESPDLNHDFKASDGGGLSSDDEAILSNLISKSKSN